MKWFERDRRAIVNAVMSLKVPKDEGKFLTHCRRVTQICVFNMVKLGTSASSP